MRGRRMWKPYELRGRPGARSMAVGFWAVAFLLTVGLGGAFAGTRLIAHFENISNADPWGRDVLRDFYNSQGVGADRNLYPNRPGVNNLRPFPLRALPFSDAGNLPGDPFEIHQFAADGTPPGFAGMVGENRFAAFGSGWSLGAQDQVEDFQINFINVANEDDDLNWRPGVPGLGSFLANNVVTGTVQDWSNYGNLCFYICVDASDIPPMVDGPNNDFWDNFKLQLWEYKIEPWPLPPPFAVTVQEREIYEVSLGDVMIVPNGVGPFTGWRHLRVPFSSFKRVDWSDTYWRYASFVTQEAFAGDGINPGMNGTLDKDAIRAIIFRKGRVVDASGNPSEPSIRVTVAIDEITVTGDTGAEVLRVNVPGQVEPIPAGPHSGQRDCSDNEDRGLCWAQVFQDDADQARPYRNQVRPTETAPNRNVDVVVTVRELQQLRTTFSAEVGSGAVVSSDPAAFSSEIVFVPQFQVPGTWVQRWLVGPDFARRKGTIHIPANPPNRERNCLFYTDWRYDYTNGVAAEKYLVRYNPLGATPFARLDPSAQPRGGFLANYLRECGYTYGTLFVLPRDAQGNIGRAWAVDVLFQTPAQPGQLRYERIMTGRP